MQIPIWEVWNMLYVEFLIDGERFELELHPGMVITKCEVRPENLWVFPWNRSVMRSMHSPTAWSEEKAHWIFEETHGRHVYRRGDGHFFWEERSQIIAWRDQQAAESIPPWEGPSLLCDDRWETSLCEDNFRHKIAPSERFLMEKAKCFPEWIKQSWFRDYRPVHPAWFLVEIKKPTMALSVAVIDTTSDRAAVGLCFFSVSYSAVCVRLSRRPQIPSTAFWPAT